MNNLWLAMPIILSHLHSKNRAGSLRESINYFLIFHFRIIATISRKLPDSLPWLILIFLRSCYLDLVVKLSLARSCEFWIFRVKFRQRSQFELNLPSQKNCIESGIRIGIIILTLRWLTLEETVRISIANSTNGAAIFNKCGNSI